MGSGPTEEVVEVVVQEKSPQHVAKVVIVVLHEGCDEITPRLEPTVDIQELGGLVRG